MKDDSVFLNKYYIYIYDFLCYGATKKDQEFVLSTQIDVKRLGE